MARTKKRRDKEISIEKLLTHPDSDNIKEWVNQHGRELHQCRAIQGVIPKEEKATLEYWLKNKISIEGRPDESVVDAIGKSGAIKVPVILDSGREYCIDGRHRLAAAIKYDLDCPVIDIDF